MIRIAPLALVIGLLLVGAGTVTCITAPPDDPRTFPTVDDALILGGLLVMIVGTSRQRFDRKTTQAR